jgi:hypothetical protein
MSTSTALHLRTSTFTAWLISMNTAMYLLTSTKLRTQLLPSIVGMDGYIAVNINIDDAVNNNSQH